MADEQSPSVEIAPTIIISNSEGIDDATSGTNNTELSIPGETGSHSENETGSHSENEPSSSVGNNDTPPSEHVAIAEIEAERDITLAAIHSDIERERIAAVAEQGNEELELCRREIVALTERVEVLANQVNLLTPPPPQEIIVTEELQTAPEPDLIPQSIIVPTAETETEHSEESVEERAEEIIPSRARKFIAI